MGLGELVSIGIILALLALQVAAPIFLFKWGKRVAARRRGAGWRYATWMPIVGLVLFLVGIGTSSYFIIRSFGAAAGPDAASRAQALAQGLAGAMTWSAMFALPAWVLYFVSIVTFAIGTLGERSPKKWPRQ